MRALPPWTKPGVLTWAVRAAVASQALRRLVAAVFVGLALKLRWRTPRMLSHAMVFRKAAQWVCSSAYRHLSFAGTRACRTDMYREPTKTNVAPAGRTNGMSMGTSKARTHAPPVRVHTRITSRPGAQEQEATHNDVTETRALEHGQKPEQNTTLSVQRKRTRTTSNYLQPTAQPLWS